VKLHYRPREWAQLSIRQQRLVEALRFYPKHYPFQAVYYWTILPHTLRKY